MGACNTRGCNGACVATGICPDEMSNPMPHVRNPYAMPGDPASKVSAFEGLRPGVGRPILGPIHGVSVGDTPDYETLRRMVQEVSDQRERERQDAYNELFRHITDETVTASMFDMHKVAGRMDQTNIETSGERLARNFGPHCDDEEGPVADVLALEARAAIAEHEDAPAYKTFDNVLEAYEELLNYFREQLDAAETALERQEGIDPGGQDYTAQTIWVDEGALFPDFGGLGDCHSKGAPDQDKFDAFDEDEGPDAVLNPHDIIDLAREIFAKRVALDTTRWGYSLTDAVNEAREAISAAND